MFRLPKSSQKVPIHAQPEQGVIQMKAFLTLSVARMKILKLTDDLGRRIGWRQSRPLGGIKRVQNAISGP